MTSNGAQLIEYLVVVTLTLLCMALCVLSESSSILQLGGQQTSSSGSGLLVAWNPKTSKADVIVAKDRSGNYTTINEAVAALAGMERNWTQRMVVYVKIGVYKERVVIEENMTNLMFVGDGIGKTIVTGNLNARNGVDIDHSGTFDISGSGFWARDMTFENTAGPQNNQAVALRVSSDQSIFYHCSFKGYQDTLFVDSNRQFYRDCHIHGTIDFIFGNPAVVFQKCDIYVRRPMNGQSNMVTAQGRTEVDDKTGISIQGSRVLPSSEFKAVKESFKTLLGRPWKNYSRTVFLETCLNDMIDPRGWAEWNDTLPPSTIFYGEYNNSGGGASIKNRVKWPGFHVLSFKDVIPFTVSKFIQGDEWIPESGVPFSPGLQLTRWSDI